jgi:hypothetical protein
MAVSTLTTLDQTAVEWLLRSAEPGVVMQAGRDILGESVDERDPAIGSGPRVAALLSGQRADGSFGKDPYSKWTGAHWRLVSLVDLGVPPGEPRASRPPRPCLTG